MFKQKMHRQQELMNEKGKIQKIMKKKRPRKLKEVIK